MKRAIAAVAALLGTLAILGAAPLSDEAAIRKFKTEDWPRAYRTQDTKLLERMLDDSFVVIGEDGEWSPKRAEIDWLAKNPWKNDGFTYTIKRLDIYGGDTAIVAGEGVIRFASGDRPRLVRYQSSNVLIKTKDGWRAVSSHVSGGKEEPLPAP